MYVIIFFFLNIQVEIENYNLYLYAIISQNFELSRFFRFKLTFGLAQFDPNETSLNHKTTLIPHHTKPHRTAPKPTLIGAGTGACNRKTVL